MVSKNSLVSRLGSFIFNRFSSRLYHQERLADNFYSVKMRGPFLVTATVCSKWADKLLSAV